ncbi:MAG: MFS transporter [Alphaproteobacteria bacterium]|nr:MFS transporter [Alphaproteobacteria bacterium]
MLKNPLKLLNWSVFFQTQIFMLPIMLLFYESNGLTKGDYFLFQGIFSIAALCFEVPAGYIADWISRKKVLILSYALFLLRLVLWYFLGGYWIILVGELLYAASKALFSGIADGYIYDLLKSKGQTTRMLKRYGRMNFFMSAGTAIASLLGATLYQEFGVMTLIVIEIVFNSIAITMLFFLPDVPSERTESLTTKEKYQDLFKIAKSALTNEKIKYYIGYSAMAVAASMIFVWSFQPLMQTAGIPVALFGVVYFINHAFRAGASYLLDKTMKIFTLKKLGVTIYGLFVIAFFAAIAMLHIKNIGINMAIMTFICFVIASQLTFTLASVSRIHSLVSSNIRSTVASLNTMVSRLLTGFVLILFKFLLDDVNMQSAFYIYLGLFLLSAYPLVRLLRQPDTKTN